MKIRIDQAKIFSLPRITVILLLLVSFVSSTTSVSSKIYLMCNVLTVGLIMGATSFLILIKRKLSGGALLLILLNGLIILVSGEGSYISLGLIVLLLILLETCDCEAYVRLTLKMTAILFFVIVLLYLLIGFNSQYDGEIWRHSIDGVGGNIFRKSLGFTHPNQAMLKWVAIVMLVIASVNEKRYKWNILACIVGTMVLYTNTKSRTSASVVLAMCMLGMIIGKRLNCQIKSRLINEIIKIMPLIGTAVSFLLMTCFYNVSWLNNILSGRPKLYNSYLRQYGLSLVGSSYLDRYGIIDNSYMHMLLTKGILFFTLYLIIMEIIFHKINKYTYGTAIAIIGYFILGICETIFLKFDMILALLLVIYSNREDKLKKDKGNVYG